MPKTRIAELEIQYTEQGSGETLLIFPDHLHTSRAYAAEVEHFSDRFRVLSFDYPGTGRSTRDVKYQDERAYDLWNFRADLACHLLIGLGLEGASVMGAGGGALAALHFAGRQAELHQLTVTGVIADSFLPRLDSRTLHRCLDTREHFYVRNAASLREQHGDDWREVIDADTAFLRRMADRGGYAFPDFVLSTIPAPALLTGSLRDPLAPGIADAFARMSAIIPDCSVYLASTSGHRYGEEHPLMWTAPDLFRQVCDVFLSRRSGGA